MIDRTRPGRLIRKTEGSIVCQKTVVFGRPITALRVPIRQMSQLGVQKPSLDRVQPPVVAFHVVIVLLRLPVIAQHLDLVGNTGIIRGHCPGFATCSEIFSGIEAERGRPAHGPGLHPAIQLRRKIFCAMRLASILNHSKTILGRPAPGSHPCRPFGRRGGPAPPRLPAVHSAG